MENPLEDDKYDEITDVVNNYLNAYLVEDSQKRLDILARYVDNIGDLSESDIAQKKYITSYSEVECYTKNGPYDNTYVVYAYYQTEYKNISTKVPSLTTYYVIRDAKTGNVYIHNKWSDEIKDYISKVSKDADVQKLISDVQKELLEAEKSDANLKKFLDALTGKQLQQLRKLLRQLHSQQLLSRNRRQHRQLNRLPQLSLQLFRRLQQLSLQKHLQQQLRQELNKTKVLRRLIVE